MHVHVVARSKQMMWGCSVNFFRSLQKDEGTYLERILPFSVTSGRQRKLDDVRRQRGGGGKLAPPAPAYLHCCNFLPLQLLT